MGQVAAVTPATRAHPLGSLGMPRLPSAGRPQRPLHICQWDFL